MIYKPTKKCELMRTKDSYVKTGCIECGKATEMRLCVTCLRDLDPEDRYERMCQEEYRMECEEE